MSTIDLDAYCNRIGYQGSRTPSLTTLQAIVTAHTHHIPFENLDSFTGKVTLLELPALQHKLVEQQRGGFCFEHNALLWQVLQQIGFSVSGLAARVRWQVPEHVVTPIGHMLLKVIADDHAYLVDAGFGGVTLTSALRMDDTSPQQTSHEPFQLVNRGNDLLLRAQLNDQWRDLYCFNDAEFLLPDYGVWNWFTCTSPLSPFTSQLMLARATPEGRHALRGCQYTFYPLRGAARSHTLDNVATLRDCITQQFQLNITDVDGLDERLAAQLNR